MLFDRIALSLPAQELVDCELPGSVFDVRRLHDMNISTRLKTAAALIASVCKQTLCVARPELFTHGASRQWLNKALGRIDTHIALSDGTAIKLLDGCSNQVFFYAQDLKHHATSLRTLLRHAPEPLTLMQSQINSFQTARLHHRTIMPNTRLLFPEHFAPCAAPQLHRFHFSQIAMENHIEATACEAVDAKLSAFKRITYIVTTETALANRQCVRKIAKAIQTAYFDVSRCVLIRLPRLNSHDVAASSAVLFDALRDSNVPLPQVMTNNVLLLSHDLPEATLHTLPRISLIIDDTFEFWRYTRAFYPRVHSALCLLTNKQAHRNDLIHAAEANLLASSQHLPNAQLAQALSTLFGREPDARADYFVIPTDRSTATQELMECAVA